MSSMLELSVVICSRNGAATLPATMNALERQSLAPERYEVIVVDDGSTDATAAIARELGAQVVQLRGGRGLAAARNAGVRAARASLIAFTDDDCEPEPDWLKALAEALRDPAVDGIGGRVIPVSDWPFLGRYLLARNPLSPLPAELLAAGGPSGRLRRYLRGILLGERELNSGAALYSPVGANMALRRELLEALGGFDETFGFGVEEEELCLRAHARSAQTLLRYEPMAVVRHHFRSSPRDGLRRAHAYGRGHARAALKHHPVASRTGSAPAHRLRPIAYPVPLIQSATLIVAGARRQPGLALAAALAPPVVYGRWATLAWRQRSVVPIAYAYLEVLEEVATMLGELRGLREGYPGG